MLGQALLESSWVETINSTRSKQPLFIQIKNQLAQQFPQVDKELLAFLISFSKGVQ